MTTPALAELRLFVHGWTQPGVVEDDIRKRFVGLPMVASVTEVVLNAKRFAHVQVVLKENCSADDFMTKLKQTYRNAKWKGGALQFEISLPDYKKRLEQEWSSQTETSKLGLDGSNSTGSSAILSREEEKALRIRKRKGEHIVLKKPKLAEYAQDEEEEGKGEAPMQYYCQMDVPSSHSAAYCCSVGDAGPTTTTTSAMAMPPAAAISAPAEAVTATATAAADTPPVDADVLLPPTALALFARARLMEMKPKKQVKDSKTSIIGRWLAACAKAPIAAV